MRLLFSEFLSTYEAYRFPYQVWAVEDSVDERELLLAQGFMPSRMKVGLWYLGRSSRIDLAAFEESSENRRIKKNTQEYEVTIEPIANFDVALHLPWITPAAQKISESISETGLKRMFSEHLTSFVFVWRKKGDETVVAVVPLLAAQQSLFYWMSFFNVDQMPSGLGTRMMLEVIEWARSNEFDSVYLGTVYTPSSLYKTNFAGFEFFNGFEWSRDLDQLKFLIGRTSEQELFKDQEFLDRFYEGSARAILRSS